MIKELFGTVWLDRKFLFDLKGYIRFLSILASI
jgi:hypothetical protein